MTHSESRPEPNSSGESLSLIEAVARHEHVLLERLAQAERDAEGIVERAHAQAGALAAEASKRLAAEIRAIRQAGAEAGARAESEVRSATERELALALSRTRARTGEAVQAVVRLVLPSFSGEAGP